MKRILALALTLVLSLGVVFAAGQESYAASSGKLIKKVTHYYKSGSKWKKYSTTSYTYNSKKDPVKIVISGKYYGSTTSKTVYTIKYKYTDGKKTEARTYVKYPENDKSALETIVTYDSKGRRKTITFVDPEDEDMVFSKQTYVYGKNGYVKKIKGDYGDTVIKYSWNKKKPKVLKSWLKYDGGKAKQSYVKFNKKGFIEKPRVYTQADPVMIYTYKYKKGMVNTINLEMQEGYDRYYEKDVITYTKKSISSTRYRAMINDIIDSDPMVTGTTWY